MDVYVEVHICCCISVHLGGKQGTGTHRVPVSSVDKARRILEVEGWREDSSARFAEVAPDRNLMQAGGGCGVGGWVGRVTDGQAANRVCRGVCV